MRKQLRAQSLWRTEAEGTGWRQTYLLSFLFICWLWSQVRTFSNHFCDGERKSGLKGTRCTLLQLHTHPVSGLGSVGVSTQEFYAPSCRTAEDTKGSRG